MFTAALFTIAKTCKQPKCPSTDDWVKKIWCVCVCVCVCIMEYYSAIKRKAFESLLVRWMKLGPIKQNEIRKRKRNIIH